MLKIRCRNLGFRMLVLRYACLSPIILTTSTTRQEYPHSLSYQERIFTRLSPMTSVDMASKIEESGFFLKSTDTSGSGE